MYSPFRSLQQFSLFSFLSVSGYVSGDGPSVGQAFHPSVGMLVNLHNFWHLWRDTTSELVYILCLAFFTVRQPFQFESDQPTNTLTD